MTDLDAALSRHARRAKPKVKTVAITTETIKVTRDAIAINGSHELAFSKGKDANPLEPMLLLYDHSVGAYRPVLTPPGKSFELVEKRSGPTLWRPNRKPS